MNLISVEKATSLWYFHLPDLNPRNRGLNKIPEVLAERYSFAKIPSLLDAYEAAQKNDGVEFLGGTFVNSRGESTKVDLYLYKQGLTADSGSCTEDTDEFLSDVLEWIPKMLSLPEVSELKPTKRYISNVNIKVNGSLGSINPNLAKFCSLIRESLSDPASQVLELGGLSFYSDPATNQYPSIRDFHIRRAKDEPFSDERYWSSAPVESAKHMRLLEAFEKLLAV